MLVLPEQQAERQFATPPNQVPLTATEDNRIAKSARPSLIPQDPIGAHQAVESMKTGIREAIQNKETITFLLTHPKDEQEHFVFVSNLLSSACRVAPRQCWFTQEGNPTES